MAVVVTFPTNPIYAFSPNVITITGLTANQSVDFSIAASFGTFTLKRYAPTSGIVIMPISKIAKSAFAGVDVGDCETVANGNVNSGSKLFKTLTVTVDYGTGTSAATLNCLYGALQLGQPFIASEKIYRFGEVLPLSVMQYAGTSIRLNGTTSLGNKIGKDVFVDPYATKLEVMQSTTILKTWDVVDLPTCSDNVYIRWIDSYGQYKYFEFIKIESYQDVKAGDIFTKELLTLDATTNGLYKSQSSVIDLSGNEIIALGYPSATYEIQKFIQSLSTALKVYMYTSDSKWLEVTAKFNAIKIDERWKQNQSIEFEIVMPNLYLQSL